MTLSTSLVAVWYSSDSWRSPVRSLSSLNSRTFSIAITAWSAKVFKRSICLSLNSSTSRRATVIAPIGLPSRSIGTESMVRQPGLGDAQMREFGIGGHIGDMRHLPRQDRARRQAAAAGRERKYAVDRVELGGGQAVMGDKVDQRAVEPEDAAVGRARQRRRGGGDRVEGRLDIGRRTRNDPQDLGRRGLALQRLALLGQQARVLDRDDRLIGKGADQLDLPLGKWLHSDCARG